jgi:hypothetical protein
MEVKSDPFESAKSHFFDTSNWGEFCDVTLTLKQAWQPDGELSPIFGDGAAGQAAAVMG